MGGASRRTPVRIMFARPQRRRCFSGTKDRVMKLYVGNLPFTATEDDLRDLFAPYGTLTPSR